MKGGETGLWQAVMFRAKLLFEGVKGSMAELYGDRRVAEK
jgi:hypothetical protein